MSLEQAATMLLLMLVAQIPLLITATVNYLKSRESARNAATAVVVAADAAKTLGDKLDHNTETTNAVNTKAGKIVEQTDGTIDTVKNLVQTLAERVAKLEEYNHSSNHRLIDAMNAVHLKLTEVAALQPKPNSEAKEQT